MLFSNVLFKQMELSRLCLRKWILYYNMHHFAIYTVHLALVVSQIFEQIRFLPPTLRAVFTL